MEESIYQWMAIVGCTILAIQIVLQLIGLDSEADIEVDGDVDIDVDGDLDLGNWFFGFLSLKAMVAFVGIFGLTGLSLMDAHLSAGMRLLYSFLAGCVAVVVVGMMMKMLHSLGESGTVEITNALGRQGSVYLSIPASGSGRGKITIEIQGRTIELAAVTDGDELTTGRMIQVVEVMGDETVKVIPA